MTCIILRCTHCGAEDCVHLTIPTPCEVLNARIDREAHGLGWVVRRPAGRGVEMLCPECRRLP